MPSDETIIRADSCQCVTSKVVLGEQSMCTAGDVAQSSLAAFHTIQFTLQGAQSSRSTIRGRHARTLTTAGDVECFGGKHCESLGPRAGHRRTTSPLSQPSVPEACGDGRMRQSQRKHVPARAAGVKVRKKIPLALADTDKSISNSNKSIDSIIYNNLDFNQRSAKLFPVLLPSHWIINNQAFIFILVNLYWSFQSFESNKYIKVCCI